MRNAIWFVWNPNGWAPWFAHQSRQSTDDEARRLCVENPGQFFLVLKSVGGFSAEKPVAKKLTKADCVHVAEGRLPDEIPF